MQLVQARLIGGEPVHTFRKLGTAAQRGLRAILRLNYLLISVDWLATHSQVPFSLT